MIDMSSCTIVDRDFYNTGWNIQRFPGPDCGDVKQLTISVQSTGDQIDRLVILGRNNCEVARFITPFDSSLTQTESVDEPISSAAASGEVEVLFTTFAAGGGGYHMTATAVGSGSPTYACIPMWFAVDLYSNGNVLSANLNNTYIYGGFVLNMTGHRYEEGATGRHFELYVNGQKVWDQVFPNWRWVPGIGFVQPIVIPYTGVANDVKLVCTNCGNTWIVSGWAYTRPPTALTPWVIDAIAALLGVLIGAVIATKT